MARILDFPLYQKQFDFVMETARFPAFIAGVGTGKTDAGVKKAIYKAIKNPGKLGCIVAPTYAMLSDTTKRDFFRVCPPELIHKRNDSQDGNYVELRADGGGITPILFRSAHRPDALRGLNLLWAYADEAAMMDVEVFHILMQRIRVNPSREQQLWITTTPKGHNWVYKLWGTDKQTKRKLNTDPTYWSVTASTRDNIFTSEEYKASLFNRFKGSWAAQELLGEFVGFDGLVYGDLFSRLKHVVPFWDDPEVGITGRDLFHPNLAVDLAWDFGIRDPEAVLAIQQDAYGNIYIIDEVYRAGVLTEDIAADVKNRLWFNQVRDVLCDAASPSNILRLTQLQIPARPANKGTIQEGIKLVRELFGDNPQSQAPRLQISSKCENLITELESYKWKDRKSESDDWGDQPLDQWNHALDALRYWTNTKWRRPMDLANRGRKTPVKRNVMQWELMG